MSSDINNKIPDAVGTTTTTTATTTNGEVEVSLSDEAAATTAATNPPATSAGHAGDSTTASPSISPSPSPPEIRRCTDCHRLLQRRSWWKFWEPTEYPCEGSSTGKSSQCSTSNGNAGNSESAKTTATSSSQVQGTSSHDCCPSILCKACYNRRPLMVLEEDNINAPIPKEKDEKMDNNSNKNGVADSSNGADTDTPATSTSPTSTNVLDHVVMKRYCKKCFEQQSTIDFRHPYTIIEPDGPDPGADEGDDQGVTFVFVHGGGASRQLFREHALELKTRYRYSSILIDLPGHGAQVDTFLTPDSCCQFVRSVLNACGYTNRTHSNRKVVYVGGSLGAYLGFYILDKLKYAFDGAILMDCGQNVGPGASLKAKMGLIMLNWVGTNCSNATIMNMMLSVSKKSKADYKLLETTFGAGMFFDKAHAQVECLSNISPSQHLSHIPFPILFMNGSEDYRDSEDLWLELCTHPQSQLHVYEGGDHFFTHDTRFFDDILQRIDTFVKNIEK